jgi:hypothetical protein
MKTLNPISQRLLAALVVAWAGANTAALAQPALAWARAGTTGSSCTGRAVAVDSAGNVLVAGRFYGTLDFGGTNFSAYNGSPEDGFLAKYDSDGRLSWATRMGGPNPDQVTGVAVDASGNAIVTGFFNGTAYFDPTNLVATSSHETFIAKYAPNGALVWAARCGGSGPAAWGGVAVDGAGNLFVTGSLSGAGTFGQTNLSSAGSFDAFVVKLTPGGEFVWVRAFGGRGYAYGRAIAAEASGRVVIAGAFSDTMMVGQQCLLARGGEDVFALQLDAGGHPLWAQRGGGGSGDTAFAVALDRHGNSFVGGYFSGSAPFETTNLLSQGGADLLVIKYDPAGRELWARGLAGNSDEVIYGLAADSAGAVHVTGYFSSSPLTIGVTNLFWNGSYDAFAAKLSSEGHPLWALRLGANSHDYGYAVALDAMGNLHWVGQFGGNVVLANTNLNNPSSEGLFVTRWNRDLPIFTAQPVGAVVMEGTELTLSAAVTGTGPLAFQWAQNGETIPGATNGPSLPLFAATWHTGDYRLIACNYEGCVTSAVASVIVYTLAEGVDEPGLIWTSGGHAPWFNQTNFTFDGVDALRSGPMTNSQQSWLQTQVRGTARVSFQWRISSENGYDFLRFAINGVEVTNTSGKIEWKPQSFLVGPGLSTLRWTYTKDESESVGQDAGWVDALTVVYAPEAITGPHSQVVTAGMTATFSAVAGGTPPLDYQWWREGVPLAGATNQTLVLPNVSPAQAGAYFLSVSNSAGGLISAAAQLTVRVPPAITSQPASHTVAIGGAVSLSVIAGGVGPFIYQWRRNGVDLPGANSATLTLSNLRPELAGAYTVLITSANGSTVSEPALVTVAGLVLRPTVFVAGTVGRAYRIEFADALAPNNWMTLTNFFLPTSPYHHVDFSAEGQPKRFYRVVPE